MCEGNCHLHFLHCSHALSQQTLGLPEGGAAGVEERAKCDPRKLRADHEGVLAVPRSQRQAVMLREGGDGTVGTGKKKVEAEQEGVGLGTGMVRLQMLVCCGGGLEKCLLKAEADSGAEWIYWRCHVVLLGEPTGSASFPSPSVFGSAPPPHRCPRTHSPSGCASAAWPGIVSIAPRRHLKMSLSLTRGCCDWAPWLRENGCVSGSALQLRRH